MNNYSIEERIYDLTNKSKFEDAVSLLISIVDLEVRIQICYQALTCLAISKVTDEYGEVVMMEDKDEYENAKRGIGNYSPHMVLFRDQDDTVHGLDDMLDFIPEDNPLKQYYHKIEED